MFDQIDIYRDVGVRSFSAQSAKLEHNAVQFCQSKKYLLWALNLSPFQMFWWVCCSSNSKQKTIFNALNQINISSSMLVQSYFHALQMINQIGHIISVRPSLCVWSLTHQFQPQHQIIIIFSVGPEYKQNYIKVYRGHLGVSENQ